MSDRKYYEKRAEAEREAATKATDPSAASVHLELAREYESRVATDPYRDAPGSSVKQRLIH